MKLKLSPFYKEKGHKLETELVKNGNSLHLTYTISGEIGEIALPDYQSNNERSWELWEHTCFEMFIAKDDREDYLEFNFSPSGNWNAFHLDGIRKGIKEYPGASVSIEAPVVTTEQYTQKVVVNLEDQSFLGDDTAVGVTAITNMKDKKEFWALLHSKGEPDFHTKESFILSLN